MRIDNTNIVPDLAAGFVPFQLFAENGVLQCKWINVSGKRFTEPFFSDTIALCRHAAVNAGKMPQFITSAAEMLQTATGLPKITPALIVFHLSRCGSTLISQAFATSERFTVLSEAPFLDEILRLPFRDTSYGTPEVTGMLDAALRFYGNKHKGSGEQVIIKTDCWHIFFYETLRATFPETPFVLMYRNPAEVLRSLLKMPGTQIVPQIVEPEIFGLPGMPEIYNLQSYTSSIIEKILEKFLAVAKTDSRAILINYNEGIDCAPEKIARMAGLKISEQERVQINGRMRFHSKKPGEVFTAEPEAEVPEPVRPSVGRYNELEDLRKQRSSA